MNICDCGADKRLVNDYYWTCDKCTLQAEISANLQKYVGKKATSEVKKQMVEELANAGWWDEIDRSVVDCSLQMYQKTLPGPAPQPEGPDRFVHGLESVFLHGTLSSIKKALKPFVGLKMTPEIQARLASVYFDVIPVGVDVTFEPATGMLTIKGGNGIEKHDLSLPEVGDVYYQPSMKNYFEVEMVNLKQQYVVAVTCYTRHTHLNDRVVITFAALESAYDRVAKP